MPESHGLQTTMYGTPVANLKSIVHGLTYVFCSHPLAATVSGRITSQCATWGWHASQGSARRSSAISKPQKGLKTVTQTPDRIEPPPANPTSHWVSLESEFNRISGVLPTRSRTDKHTLGRRCNSLHRAVAGELHTSNVRPV